MRKIAGVVIPLIVAFLVFGGLLFIFGRNSGKGALQVTAYPKSNVYLNGNLIGETPLTKSDPKEMLEVGEYTIRIVPQEEGYSAFEEKISIHKAVLTVVDRTFGQGGGSEGSVITLSPADKKDDVGLLILSLPEKADVFVNNSRKGATPLFLNDLSESDHEIKITKDGYGEKVVRIRTVKGYKLTTIIYLATNSQVPPSPIEEVTTSEIEEKTRVTILQSPVGYVNVRTQPSVSSAKIGEVKPGETYVFIEERDGWFQIELEEEKPGWITAQYVQKITE